MNALSLLTAFLTIHGAGAQKNLSLDAYLMNGSNRTLVKSGDSLTGEVQFRVIVQTDTPIQAVEFYVGDDLRESDGSVPYEFKLDTLTEEDGNIKVRFKGFTSQGQNVEKVYNLKIDNGISKGADFHVDKGNGFLTEGKVDEAITEGRIAQKADKASLGARILLAKANFSKGQYDKAQKFAEDALEVDKSNRAAREVIISLKVQQAFNAVSRSADDRKEVIDSIKKGLSEAIKYRTSLLNEDVDRLSSNKSSLEYLDAAIRARRYSLVIDSLAGPLKTNFKNNDQSGRSSRGRSHQREEVW
jgi:tetratricopeptide (TPR) repeat protein